MSALGVCIRDDYTDHLHPFNDVYLGLRADRLIDFTDRTHATHPAAIKLLKKLFGDPAGIH